MSSARKLNPEQMVILNLFFFWTQFYWGKKIHAFQKENFSLLCKKSIEGLKHYFRH